MVAPAYVDDVFDLVRMMSTAELPRRIIDQSPSAADDVEVLLTTYVQSDDIRPALALLQFVQLAFDAAAVTVDAANRDFMPGDISRDFVESGLSESLIQLTIVQLSDGSFLARFSINPLTKHGRTRLLAIVGLAALALSAFISPVPGMVIEGLAMANEAFTPDELKKAEVPVRTADATVISIAATVTVTFEIRQKAA